MSAINPIIPGFAPDPSIVGVGNWYFLVTSSFHLFPGLPIYASKDLVSWQHIGNAIHRPNQLSLKGSEARLRPSLVAGGGLYAPTIRHHNDTFYIVSTNSVRGRPTSETPNDSKQNFIVSTRDIWTNDWSDPVYFDFDGIDPDLFFENGKTYVAGSAPGSGINLFEIDIGTARKLSPERTIWTGSGGEHPEGPHIYKQKGYYCLMVAEGGTHEGHMVTMARARDIWGPYESCPQNPILTARGTSEYIQHTGHCDAIQDEQGQWWGVCLGVRKDKKGRYALGRETFLTRGDWTGDWLSFQPVTVSPVGLVRAEQQTGLSRAPNVDLVYIRDPDLRNYEISDAGATAALTASQVDLDHPELSPTFVGKRQRVLAGQSEVILCRESESWTRAKAPVKAGLACYKDEHRYLRVFYEASRSVISFELCNNARQITKTVEREIGGWNDIKLAIRFTGMQYQILYGHPGSLGNELTLLAVVDVMDLMEADFVGPVIGIFAVTEADSYPIRFSNLSIE